MNLPALLIVSTTLFAIGMYGLLSRRNIIAMFMSIELMINAAIINFMAFSRYGTAHMDADAGNIFPLFIIALTSAEMAIALAIVVTMYRRKREIDAEGVADLNG